MDKNLRPLNDGKEKIIDKLEFLFYKQKTLIEKDLSQPLASNEIDKSISSPTNKMKNLYNLKEPFSGYRIFMICSALLHETVELQRETNWKWWKTNKELEMDKIQEEVIDLWHFLIQLSIESGLNPTSLVERYIKKNKENLNRQKKGY